MDNDQQVTDLVRSTRDRFLNQPLDPDDRDSDHFNLENEFAQTRSNRSLLIPVSVGLFIVVLAIGAVIASFVAEDINRQSTIEIGSFEDLKLKELFDTAKKNQRDLDEVKRQIEVVESEYASRVESINQDTKAKSDLVALSRDAPAAKSNQLAEIQARQNKSVANERQTRDAKLVVLREKAAEIQKKVDSYDTRIGSIEKKNQALLDSQQRLYDLEKKKMSDTYEARIKTMKAENANTIYKMKTERQNYVDALNLKHANEVKELVLKFNPVIDDPELVALFSNYSTVETAYSPTALPDRLVRKDLISKEFHQSLQQRVQKAQQLLATLKATGFVNSMPALVHTLDALVAESLNGYDGYLTPLASKMMTMDQTIGTQNRWVFAVNEYVKDLKDVGGIVIDARNPLDILMAFKTDVESTIKGGEIATVRDSSNNDDLGTIELQVKEARVIGKLLTQRNVFRPFKQFDRLTVQPAPTPSPKPVEATGAPTSATSDSTATASPAPTPAN